MARATCEDCGATFETPRPSYGHLACWECTDCEGRLEVHIECDACGKTNTRTTGWKAMYSSFDRPKVCDRCGEFMGLANTMPGHFSGRHANSRRPSRLVLGVIFLFYAFIVSVVFGFSGMISGAIFGFLSLLVLGPLNALLEFGIEEIPTSTILGIAALLGLAVSTTIATLYSIDQIGEVIAKESPERID